MELAFLGAAQTVTGSMHVLTVNGTRILIECGLYQGRRKESFQRNRNLPFDATQIDLLVLSHAHIDHSGNIPSLVKSGFRGNMFATPGTRDLCAIMLRDSGHIHESDAAYLNKKRRQSGLPLIEPLYTQEDAARSMDQFISINYDRPFPISPGVTLTFHDAGHILGSAMVCLDIDGDGRRQRLLFTGDLGRVGAPLLRDPYIPRDVNILIIESTYGDRLHGPMGENMSQLRDVVNQTCGQGGKLIIPAFSVGRTQNVVYTLHQLFKNNEIPDLPVYVDSPLSVNATEVFLLHPECYDEETRQFLAETSSQNPFSFNGVRYIREVEQSKAINSLRGPAIIISASGMCETGRILHHLKNNIEDKRNTVAIVGWQAPHTLGRRLVEKQKRVKIFGEEYVRRAGVEVLNGLSAHADRDELLDWFKQVRNPGLERVFVVHGEKEASESLAQAMGGLHPANILVPEPGQHVRM
ncbi:MAG: MBL fold metallo-hydrolase [Anaerolineae bacterium]|jgi:metallo-beta-lactamase family protein|nr:MBL fold metallo-hydrolase [Anaerolineae bacterium]